MDSLDLGADRPPTGPHRAGKPSAVKALSLGALLLALAWVSYAAAQPASSPVCAARKVIISNLAKEYKETPVARGLIDSGALLEVFASIGGGTFTVLLSLPNGVSCLTAAGEGWEFVFAKPPGDES